MTGARIADAAPMRQATVPARAGLPRLLYIADVPVEASYHGSALVYRLLQTYPAKRLTVIEAGTQLSLPARRLEGVTYVEKTLPLSRESRPPPGMSNKASNRLATDGAPRGAPKGSTKGRGGK